MTDASPGATPGHHRRTRRPPRDGVPPPRGRVAPSRPTDPLARLVQLGGRLLVIADFDGTLAEFDPDPMGAVIVPSARRALRRLARIAVGRSDRLVVAILTGRASLDVACRVRVGGVRYLGNMGNETGILPRRSRAERLEVVPAPGLEGHVTPAARLAEAVVAALAAEAGSPPGWLFVEPKGPAVAFHWRAAPDREAARQRIEAALAVAEEAGRLHAFTRIDGRCLVDFQPTGAGAKGEATERLIEEVGAVAAIVVGDDRADAEAFEAVRRGRSDGTLRDGLAVAVRHPHPLPAEVEAAADVAVDGTRAVVGMLSALARLLEREERAASAATGSDASTSWRRRREHASTRARQHASRRQHPA